MVKLPSVLTATVTHDVNPKGKAHRCPVITTATVRLGSVIVAGAILGGKYNPAQVLSELQKNPSRFVQHAGWKDAALGITPQKRSADQIRGYK